MNVAYTLLYKQYYSLFSNPTKVSDYAEASGTFFWFDSILKKRREIQFQKIKKEQDDAALVRNFRENKSGLQFQRSRNDLFEIFLQPNKIR